MCTYRPHHQFVIDCVEETFDVEVQHPIVLPAALARRSNGIQRRFALTVTIGIRVELLF